MSGMAEVLAAHNLLSHERSGTYACSDPDCGWELRRYRSRMDDLLRGVDVVAREFAAHQAEMLTAAGFGDVLEAKAQALEDAAREMREERHGWCLDDAGRYWIKRTLDDLEDRAAAVRGEG